MCRIAHEVVNLGLDGTRLHARVDRPDDPLPTVEEMPTEGEVIARGVTLSDDEHQIIARLDVLEYTDGHARPVDTETHLIF